MAISEGVSEEEHEIPPMEELPDPTHITPPSDQLEVESVISLNSLTDFFAFQTLKIICYIKNQKVIILIDNGRNHHFIHCHISQETHCYIHAVNNFQIMIANGG
jgi:hypothetical protein